MRHRSILDRPLPHNMDEEAVTRETARIMNSQGKETCIGETGYPDNLPEQVHLKGPPHIPVFRSRIPHDVRQPSR